MANSVDPDQTAPSGAVWSGSALFAYVILSETLVFEFLGQLPYIKRKQQGFISAEQFTNWTADCLLNIYSVPKDNTTIYPLIIQTKLPQEAVYTQIRCHWMLSLIRVYTIWNSSNSILTISMLGKNFNWQHIKIFFPRKQALIIIQ